MTRPKKSVLIAHQSTIPHYRVPFFNGNRSLPRLRQGSEGEAGASVVDGGLQVKPGRVSALPAGVDDAG